MLEFFHALDLNFLIGIFVGMVAGGALGFAGGDARGRLHAYDAMREHMRTPAPGAIGEPEIKETMQAIRDRMHAIDMGALGPFGEFL
jgi:hypothetical protein